MAEEPQYAKRKFDDEAEAPLPRRASGFSSGPASDPLAAATAAARAAAAAAIPVDEIELAKQRAQEIASRIFITAEAKRPRVENGAAAAGGAEETKGFGSTVTEYSLKPQSQSSPAQVGMANLSSSFPAYGFQSLSKKIEIPNARVGVIIGKGGETIRNLQLQSGAKIQVTRDMDHNPNSQTRPVELVGTPEQISKAEQMVTEVLAEAEIGGSGTNAPRKFSTPIGGETFIMKVPNNKVGLVIGKGGETIKSMQAKSGARIQLVPLHPPPGDTSTERTVHIDGSKEQIELAKQLISEVTSENRVRIPQMTGGYSQQGYRPPRPPTSWAPPGAPQVQQPGYGYMQPGAYTGQPPPYNMPQQPYAGYPPPAPPASGGFTSGWDQSSNPAAQPTTPVPGYDYYNQQPQQQPQNQQPVAASSTPADATTYNYNQQPATNYNPQGVYADPNFPHTTVGQQTYGQDAYSGGYNASTNQQGYPQTGYPQTGYDQQGYGTAQTAYGAPANPTQDGSATTYGAPGVPSAQQGYGTAQTAYGQPSNPTQDGSAPTYSAPGVPTQVPPQQAPQSAQPSTTQQAYAVPQPSSATPSYPPQGSTQAGYGPPPTVQPGYGSQPPAQPGYGQPAPSTQPSYIQPAPALAGYPQNQPGHPAQSGYGQDASQYRPPGFAPGVPQQGYGQQQPHGSVAPQSQPAYSQPYGDSYGSGGYSQPPAYSNDNSVTVSQSVPSVAAKVSPQS